jgi:hypothetical protein
MKRLPSLAVLLALYLSAFLNPSLALQSMTESQTAILRQTMAADGHVNQEMHKKFWADAPKNLNGEADSVFIWLVNSTKLAQEYQRALWQSALFSYEQRELVRTESLGQSERELEKMNISNSPFKKGSKDYDDFVKAYTAQSRISAENAKRLLEAAASHGELKAVNGETVKVDGTLIRTVLDQMNSSFARLRILLNPVWAGEQIE